MNKIIIASGLLFATTLALYALPLSLLASSSFSPAAPTSVAAQQESTPPVLVNEKLFSDHLEHNALNITLEDTGSSYLLSFASKLPADLSVLTDPQRIAHVSVSQTVGSSTVHYIVTKVGTSYYVTIPYSAFSTATSTFSIGCWGLGADTTDLSSAFYASSFNIWSLI